jgi:hypothetical protein
MTKAEVPYPRQVLVAGGKRFYINLTPSSIHHTPSEAPLLLIVGG